MQTYTHYKESGIDWIGQIPEHWEIRRFKYLFNEINERSIDGNEDLLSVSQYTGVTKKSDKIDDGDLLTNASTLEGYKKVRKHQLVSNIMLAWNGSLAFSEYNGITSPAYCIYELKHDDVYKYFHYLFKTDLYKSEFKRNSSGVIESRLRLYTDDFFSIWSVLPPIQEQEAIANFLDDKTAKIDALVQTKEQQIEKLKELRQAKIHQAVSKGIRCHAELVEASSKTHALSKVEMKDSGVPWIGEIPAHWEVKRLKNVGEFINGYAFNSESFLSEGIKVMKISNIQTMKTDWSDLSCVDVKYFEALEKFRVLQGDLVFALTRPIISTGIKATIVFENEKILINQRNAILRTKGDFDIKWLYYIILDSSFIQEFDNQIDKTGQQPNISTYNIGNISIPFPRKKDIEQIVTYLDEVTGKIDQAITQKQVQITKLKEYKQSLINNVVKGKVKVC